jgi:dihydropyrimidinase
MDLLIKNARIVTPSDTFESNIGIGDGRIVSISPSLKPDGARTYDARGMPVIPGGIDEHTHMEMPALGTVSADDFHSGTVAAACGGITTILDFVDPLPGEKLLDALSRYRGKADPKVVIDYGLHMVFKQQSLPEIDSIPEVVGLGVPSFKLFTTYRKRGLMLEDADISRVMRRIASVGGLTAVHAESNEIIEKLTDASVAAGKTGVKYHALCRPPIAEAEAISSVARLSKSAGSPLCIVHLSSRVGMEAATAARSDGANIFAETCPHYLVLTDQVYLRKDAENFVMSPALKKAEDRASLWKGLRTGGIIETVGSDHCPFTSSQKRRGKEDFTRIPNGVAGTEAIIPILYSEGVHKRRISIQDLVRVTSCAPAAHFGLYPTKGSLTVGSDADLVVIDPKKRVRMSAENLHSKIDYSIYDGITTEGYPVLTVSRGEIVMEDGDFVGRKGRGRFLARSLRKSAAS